MFTSINEFKKSLLVPENSTIIIKETNQSCIFKSYGKSTNTVEIILNEKSYFVPEDSVILVEESLSKDRANEAKLKMLVDAAREMMEAKLKAKELNDLRKIKNKEIEEALDALNTSSIIANGVLIEVIKPYETHRLNTAEYVDFVEQSVDVIGKEFMEMHNKAVELATSVGGGTKYFMQHANKGYDTGTIVEGENIFKRFTNWIKSLVGTLKDKINSFKTTLNQIEDRAEYFNSLVNESYTGRKSKYIDMILDTLTKQSDITYQELAKLSNVSLGSYMDLGLYRNLRKLLDLNIVTREKRSGSRAYFYKLVNSTDVVDSSEIDEVDDTDTTILPDIDPVISVLELAKETIEIANQESYYKELADIKQKQVIELLESFNGKKIAIDDKILTLVEKKDKPTMSWAQYQDIMSNGEIVSDGVADMANDLFSLYSKVSQVSGSVRQYKDDKNLPDGTLGATFDYVFKTVLAPDENPNFKPAIQENVFNKLGSWFKRSVRFIKQLFNKFKITSRTVDNALDMI